MKKIIIVGAGIAGLTAGIYARKSGFDVTIYESHTIPGGASTSWRRKGYLFEGGMHWLTGSSPKTPLNKLWREVGALDNNTEIINRDPFVTAEYNGQRACLYRDIERLRKHFMELSPEDEKMTNSLCRDLKRFSNINMPVMDIKGVKAQEKSSMKFSAILKMLPAIPRMSFYANQSVKEYASRFKSPIIRLLLENIVGPEYSATAMIFTIATLVSGDGGYPAGGSLAMANRMAKYFGKIGGNIIYGNKVGKVIVENGIATGVIINEQEILADAVIVTLDTRVAIDTMFETPIAEPWAEDMRKNTKPLINTFISIGVEADLSDLPERFDFGLDEPIMCGNIVETGIRICNYAGYKGYAPEGSTSITSPILSDTYDFWKNCKENGTYAEEKEKLATAFIDMLARKFPQTAGKVAVWDIATPLTYERYLGSYKGSWMSVMNKGDKGTSYPSMPKSIKNVYFAGQRLQSPGGLPVALDTGRKAIQYLCRDTDTVFKNN